MAAPKKVTAYDCPIYIADAAVYLMATQPELGITNPYALDETQFQAAVDLLKQQRDDDRPLLGRLSRTRSPASSPATSSWAPRGRSPPTCSARPTRHARRGHPAQGGLDRLVRHVDAVVAKAQHPNCGYLFMNHIISPEANAMATEYFGEAPVQRQGLRAHRGPRPLRDLPRRRTRSTATNVYYWATPQAECLDGRTDVVCKDYSEWTAAWTEIKG